MKEVQEKENLPINKNILVLPLKGEACLYKGNYVSVNTVVLCHFHIMEARASISQNKDNHLKPPC